MMHLFLFDLYYSFIITFQMFQILLIRQHTASTSNEMNEYIAFIVQIIYSRQEAQSVQDKEELNMHIYYLL